MHISIAQSFYCLLIPHPGIEAAWHAQAEALSSWTLEKLLVGGAIAIFHAGVVPERLLALVVPRLTQLAVGSGPGNSPPVGQALAAAVLAEGLSGPPAERWRPYIGNLAALTERVLGLCEQLGALTGSSEKGSSGGDAVQWRDSLNTLLSPLAAADLPCFLHLLGHRCVQALQGRTSKNRLFQVGLANEGLASMLTCMIRDGIASLDPCWCTCG